VTFRTERGYAWSGVRRRLAVVARFCVGCSFAAAAGI